LKIKIALKRKASSIAVRFDPRKHKIQVVDNGIGFTKHELSYFFYKKASNNNDKKKIFKKIVLNSNAIIITSRSIFSTHTYVTVYL
jgi:HSP90 family molecular chaperone